MKTKITIIAAFCIFFVACEKVNTDSEFPIGKGFEIYLTEYPYIDNLDMDYSKIDFDTISLSDSPILQYNDLLNYDTITHKLTLAITHDALNIGDAGVYGRMFVVTIDKVPVYCGFKWIVISSIPCNWVYIEEPYQELDNLGNKEIVIRFNSWQYNDPRLDNRIIDRLKKDGKIRSEVSKN